MIWYYNIKEREVNKMNAKKRKEKNDFICQLTMLITEKCDTDEEYLQKLLWANEEITYCITKYFEEEL